jgi:hypothetical protein
MTPERLRELLEYDALTGVFRWRIQRQKHVAGSVAGTNREGYVVIRTGGKNYYAHRLAWLYVYGTWPEMRLDHMNGDPGDNRIANLRLATHAQNMANARKRRDQKHQKGVSARPSGRFEARISLNGRMKSLGYFDTPEGAHAAYVVAAHERSGEFASDGER